MPFRYLRDPLFVFCVVLYFVNRLVLKPHIHHGALGAFLHGSLNDVICIPFWVPIMVWMMRKVGLRNEDGPPHGAEVLIPVLLWSWFFELVLPFLGPFHRLATCDPDDILCYTLGALLAVLFWKGYYGRRQKESPVIAVNKQPGLFDQGEPYHARSVCRRLTGRSAHPCPEPIGRHEERAEPEGPVHE